MTESEAGTKPGANGAAVGAGHRSAARADLGILGTDGHVRPLAEIEGTAIRLALRIYDGNLSEAARRLGIGRSTLYRKLAALQAGARRRG